MVISSHWAQIKASSLRIREIIDRSTLTSLLGEPHFISSLSLSSVLASTTAASLLCTNISLSLSLSLSLLFLPHKWYVALFRFYHFLKLLVDYTVHSVLGMMPCVAFLYTEGAWEAFLFRCFTESLLYDFFPPLIFINIQKMFYMKINTMEKR